MNSTLSHHSDATLITDYNSFPLNCQRELGFNTMWITKFVLRIPTVRNILKSFIRLFQRLFGRHKSLDSILCDNKVFFVIFWNFSFNCLSVVKYLWQTPKRSLFADSGIHKSRLWDVIYSYHANAIPLEIQDFNC